MRACSIPYLVHSAFEVRDRGGVSRAAKTPSRLLLCLSIPLQTTDRAAPIAPSTFVFVVRCLRFLPRVRPATTATPNKTH